MKIFKNPFAQARDQKNINNEIDKAVDLMRPKHSIEALQTPFYVFNVFGLLAGVFGTVSGITYLNFAINGNADPLQAISVLSLLILAILEIGKKVSQFNFTAAFLRGDKMQGYILLVPFALFALFSVYSSLQGVKLYFAQSEIEFEKESLTTSQVVKFDLDSISLVFDKEIKEIGNEIALINDKKETYIKQGGHWSPLVADCTSKINSLQEKISAIGFKQEKALSIAEEKNQKHKESLLGIKKQEITAKNSETWVFTVISEIIGLLAVAFANFYYYLGAFDQVATQPNLQHTAIKAHFVETDGSPSIANEVQSIKQSVGELTLFINSLSTQSVKAISNQSVNKPISLKPTLSTQSVSALSNELKGTGCKDLEEFTIKYEALIKAISEGIIDNRTLVNKFGCNIHTVVFAKELVNKKER
jgi:hypothetical protein